MVDAVKSTLIRTKYINLDHQKNSQCSDTHWNISYTWL